jgi:hypothetical protein
MALSSESAGHAELVRRVDEGPDHFTVAFMAPCAAFLQPKLRIEGNSPSLVGQAAVRGA